MDGNNLTSENYLNVCRFCLIQRSDVEIFSAEQLSTSRISSLYKSLMDCEMTVTRNHPILFCNSCVKELETAVQIQEHFKKIEEFWTRFLNDLNEPIKIKTEQEFLVAANAEQCLETTITSTTDTVENVKPNLNIFTIENETAKFENLVGISQITQVLVEESGKELLENENTRILRRRQTCNLHGRASKSLEYNKNYKNAPFIRYCDKCGQSFRSRSLLLKHLYDHIDKRCDICCLAFKTLSQWLKHHKSHYPNDSNAGNETNAISKHQKRYSRFNYRRICCQFCDKEFITILKLFMHQRCKHRAKIQIECFSCKEAFRYKSQLILHLKRKRQKEGEDGVFCHICGVIIKWGNFKRHMEYTHANGKIGRMMRLPDSALQPIKCFYCSELFKIKTRLHRHVETVHPANLVEHMKRYNIYSKNGKFLARYTERRINFKKTYKNPKAVCTVCSMKFDNREQLKDHAEIHKNYECNICRRRFIGKQILETHLKQHSTKNRPYLCEICNASFVREPHLKDHIRCKHSTDRPFSCNECGKTFCHRYELNSHVKVVHLKVKAYKCSYCEQSFSTGTGKRYHESRHTGKAIHSCKICSKAFLTMTMLDSHIGRHHKEMA